MLGEIYFVFFKVGVCEDCGNCGEYCEIIKVCMVIFKVVCGRCKFGVYVEGMLGLCKFCFLCCNDSKDIVIFEC